MEKITFERVQRYHKKGTKRICFSTLHKNALKPSRNPFSAFRGAFNVPFGETIQYLFPFQLIPNPRDKFHTDAFWRSIQNDAELEEIREWLKLQNGRVFLRDCLYTSIALSTNFSDEEERKYTPTGNLENQAKKHHDAQATFELSKKCVDAINAYPLYSSADCITAVPPSKNKDPKKGGY